MRRRDFLLWTFAAASAGRHAVAEPSAAYDLEALLDRSARKSSLARAASGKRLVVVVMKRPSCPVCIAQIQRFEAMRGRIEALGATAVAVSGDSVEEIRRAADRTALTTPIFSDPRRVVVGRLGLFRKGTSHPMPALLVFDRCGIERGRIEGRSPADRPEPAVLATLNALAKSPERCGSPAV